MLQGYIDHIEQNTVLGWVWHRKNPDVDLFVEVTGPKGHRIVARANVFRPDLLEAGIGDGRHGFSVDFHEPIAAPEGEAPGVSVRVAGTSFVLGMMGEQPRGVRGSLRSLYQSYLRKPPHAAVQALPPDSLSPACGVSALGGGRRFAPVAKIAAMTGSRVDVWTDRPADEATPVLMVGGKPAWLSPDVTAITDHPVFTTRYVFFISGIPEGAEISLSLVADGEVWLSEFRAAPQAVLERSILQQMTDAAKIAVRPGAVGIVCADGAGAIMQRAKGFLDAVEATRPAVLLCNLEDVTGLNLWSPLAGTNAAVVTIPWSERLFYLRMARAMGLRFDTLWLIEPRLPGFLLAAHLARDDATLVLDFADQTALSLPDPEEAPEHHEDLRALSLGMCCWLSDRIPARTAASAALASAHDAVLADPEDDPARLHDLLRRFEADASPQAQAGTALAILPDREVLAPRQDRDVPTLLLIWKQQDAGLYGRRIDQLCRSYRRVHPGHRVVVLEILNKEMDGTYRHPVAAFSEFSYIREMNTRKRQGCLRGRDGTEYRQIYIDHPDALHRELLEFLVAQGIVPTNSVIVLFPNIQYIERVFDILCPFPLIVDVVDNQLVWATGRARQDVLTQYFMLCQSAARILFNSALNHERFCETGLVAPGAETAAVIPNWYQLPDGFSDIAARRRAETDPSDERRFEIVYTGNMNDRIDWALMADIAGLGDTVRLHLIGEARRAGAPLAALLRNRNVIFHGPLDEEQTLARLVPADLAVIPHVVDEVSTFMNPLKVHMYKTLGLPAVAMNVPGLHAGPGLTIVRDRDEFLACITARMSGAGSPDQAIAAQDEAAVPDEARRYIEQIDQVRAQGG